MNRSLQEVKLETDVLITGGKIAGCMAAIRASELGTDVLLIVITKTPLDYYLMFYCDTAIQGNTSALMCAHD